MQERPTGSLRIVRPVALVLLLLLSTMPLLAPPAAADGRDASIVLTADHGDCWGEDGLWEHGISHRRTLEVPLLMRVRGVPLA